MNGEIALTAWELISVVVLTILAGGALTLGTVYTITKQIMNNPALMTSLESAAANVDPQTALKLVEVGKSLGGVGALVTEVFDGEPHAGKPPAAG